MNFPTTQEEWDEVFKDFPIGGPTHGCGIIDQVSFDFTINADGTVEATVTDDNRPPCDVDPFEKQNQEHDDYMWPHKGGCTLCGADAYVGFNSIDCSNGGCDNGKG